MPDPDRNLVVSIVAQNENQALRSSSEMLGRLLETRGYRHRLLDMYQPPDVEELRRLLNEGQIAFAFGIAGVGSRLALPDGTNLWTAFRTPFVSLWYDHPSYNYRQHIVDSPYVVQGYHVRDHLEMRATYLPPSSSPATLLPVRFGAGHMPDIPPYNSRQPKILFAKSGKNPRSFTDEWKNFPAALRDVLHNLADAAIKNRDIDLAAAAVAAFKAHNHPPSDLDMLMSVISEVDGYIRAWRSDRLARALLDFPACIMGDGWDYLKPETIKAEFHPAMPFSGYVRELGKYRVIANSNPLWRDGIHERANHAIVCGNIALTDRTVKSEVYFHGLKNYIAFEWQDDLAEVIFSTLTLAADSSADYIPAAESALRERVLDRTPDYVMEIEKAVGMVHENCNHDAADSQLVGPASNRHPS